MHNNFITLRGARMNSNFCENKTELDEENCKNSTKKQSSKKATSQSAMVLVVQTGVCLVILTIAFLLKSVGGNCFDYIKNWYNEKINDSLIMEKNGDEHSGLIVQSCTINSKKYGDIQQNLPQVMLSIKLFNPLDDGVITSRFGLRKDPISGRSTFHKGLDIGAEKGTPIYAAMAGRIKKSEKIGGFGNCVVIEHDNNIETWYGHCQKLMAVSGDFVERGQQVALVGSTGRSTGNHLHFGIVINGEEVDPENFLGKVYI